MIKYSSNHTLIVLLVMLFLNFNVSLLLASTTRTPSIKTTKLSENFYKLSVDNFVNMLVFNGTEGAILVDSGTNSTKLIKDELKRIGVKKIKYIINTHCHGDHVAGNHVLGSDAIIIASPKCRNILLKDNDFSRAGLPELTFSDSVSIYHNDETINLYFRPGHSSQDVVVHFTNADILCIGDYGFFQSVSRWPGSSANVYNMKKSMIWMTEQFSDTVTIITGHESEYSMANLKIDTELIKDTVRKVDSLINQKLTLAQIIEINPLINSDFLLVRENSKEWIKNIYVSKKELGLSELSVK